MIDSHCHIFNGRDLDICNYVIGDIPDWLKGTLPFVLYGIAETIRAFAPSAEDELEHLNDWLAARKKWMDSPARQANEELARADFQSELKTQVHALRDTQFKRRQDFLASPDLFERLKDQKRQELKRTQPMLAGKNPNHIELEAQWHADEVLQAMTSPAVWAFLEGFWHYRVVNAYRLIDDYPMISLFTPAMMDTDSWFQHRLLQPSFKSTSLPSQIEIYEKIAILTNGRFLPFFAFDPRRQVESASRNGAASPPPLDLVEDCLNRNCFVGLKLYPPMGYRPADNVDRDKNPPNDDWFRGLGGQLDAVLDQAFDRCMQTGLCTMAHTTESQYSDPAYHDNGSPHYWSMALQRHPELKVNLAHCGGMSGKEDPHHWKRGVFEIMSQYPNVYADVADFVDIDCRQIRNSYFRALRKWTVAHPESPVYSRLMYGSDFYMNGLFRDYEYYADNWISAFQEHFPENWRDLVGGNAANFLGLRAGPQRQRLDRFIADHDLSPEWVKRVA